MCKTLGIVDCLCIMAASGTDANWRVWKLPRYRYSMKEKQKKKKTMCDLKVNSSFNSWCMFPLLILI
jgi:hypothetical protein